MEYITLTSDIRQYFGVRQGNLVFHEVDYMIVIKRISDKFIEFTCPNLNFKYDETLNLSFDSKFGITELKVKVDVFYENEGSMTVEASFVLTDINDFFIALTTFYNNLLEEKKRKEKRILCTKKNLEILRLNNIIFLDYNFREYKCVIKDISFSAIKVLTDPDFLTVKDSLFDLKISFYKPDIFFNFIGCSIIRRKKFIFDEKILCEIVLSLGENIRYKERLSEYFRDEEQEKKRVR